MICMLDTWTPQAPGSFAMGEAREVATETMPRAYGCVVF